MSIETRTRTRVFLLTLAAGLVIAACGDNDRSTQLQGQLPDPPQSGGAAWLGFGADAQHAALSKVSTQSLSRILWRTPVDVAPQYTSQGYLFVHYGSPAITANNTVLVPVKRGVSEQYRIEARAGKTGALVWSMDTDYIMPPDHGWTPSYNVTLTTSNRMFVPGAGGKVLYRDNPDSPDSPTEVAYFFDGRAAAYEAAKEAFDNAVFINTPITADTHGNIYFGYLALPGAPARLTSGFARIGVDGSTTWSTVGELALDPLITRPATNSAPALSKDERTLYVTVLGDNGNRAYLMALNPDNLSLKSKVLLLDPHSGQPAHVREDSTASPTVGPDGDVYYGVLETTDGAHNGRGWLLHFDASLAQEKIPGSFGWDDTASIVPAAMVPGYSGSSSYLITTKYNNYHWVGSGDSKNKVAVLDPNASQPDFISGETVMKEVLTVLGPTPDPNFPSGVAEWCINTAAVDPFTRSIIVNSEDGYLYRWDLATNKLTQKVQLTSGLGESYTPTAVGPDGTVYAINNAVLFAVGK